MRYCIPLIFICVLLSLISLEVQAQGIEYAYDQVGNRIGHYLMKLVAGDEAKEFKIVRE